MPERIAPSFRSTRPGGVYAGTADGLFELPED
jgi:hypothetical protein